MVSSHIYAENFLCSKHPLERLRSENDGNKTHRSKIIIRPTEVGSKNYLLATQLNEEPGRFSGIALSYGLDDRGFESRQGLGIFRFTAVSRSALGPTESPNRWVRWALLPPSSAEVKE
jgi:hypothetical protein